MGKAVTAPPEWRRRARQARDWLEARAGPEPDLRPIGEAHPEQVTDLASASRAGLVALTTGEDEIAVWIADLLVPFAFDQPHDLPGLATRREGDTFVREEGLLIAHHDAPQDFTAVATTILLLAACFESFGDDEHLRAAIELHDLVVAMGEEVWRWPEHGALGWAAAYLYGGTGEDAFLATAERVADMVCETQRPAGFWPAMSGDAVGLTAELAYVLTNTADAVEGRQAAEAALASGSSPAEGDGEL